MEIILIAAMAANRVIGHKNEIPWYIPGEQKRFKEITWGHSLIMGRNTHESIGKPLPGRQNIIVTRNMNYRSPGCTIAHSLQEAYDLCRQEERIFNIGGEQLYTQGLEHADRLILTVLDEEKTGDAFFPYFSATEFELVAQERIEFPYAYSVQTYSRKAI